MSEDIRECKELDRTSGASCCVEKQFELRASATREFEWTLGIIQAYSMISSVPGAYRRHDEENVLLLCFPTLKIAFPESEPIPLNVLAEETVAFPEENESTDNADRLAAGWTEFPSIGSYKWESRTT
ncbi:hypothetical protein BDP27DRAFT_1358733 [Rhodocollybia butyracea]|uniref:Uncharacterized protein n=1 Tax=Rhodocollybia butyracea TaxID=206335 RepID=A0A9P5Q500_9AGAR|nr:hypothetical protein BDP27DRAFT_1358733 [Rhodocollybia butyracea]